MCNNIPRSNGELPGEDPKWVSDSEKEELEMKSSYNLIVNIVNVESPYTNKVQVDGMDQINKLVKSIMLRNNFEKFYPFFRKVLVFGKSSFFGTSSFFGMHFSKLHKSLLRKPQCKIFICFGGFKYITGVRDSHRKRLSKS